MDYVALSHDAPGGAVVSAEMLAQIYPACPKRLSQRIQRPIHREVALSAAIRMALHQRKARFAGTHGPDEPTEARCRRTEQSASLASVVSAAGRRSYVDAVPVACS